MISTLKPGCFCMKSSAAILAAVTEPSPALSEYGPEASLRIPIFIVRVASAKAGEHTLATRKDIPKMRKATFMTFHPVDDILVFQRSSISVPDFAPEQQIIIVLFDACSS